MNRASLAATLGRLLNGKSSREPPLAPSPEELKLHADIPGGEHGPLCSLRLHIERVPERQGERFRLRAHVRTNLASALRPALTGPPPAGSEASTSSTALQKAGAYALKNLQRVVAHPTIRRLTEPLLQHDLNTWIELQTSTASLDQGAHALVPAAERLAAMGIHPSRAGSQAQGPVAERWAGGNASGFAQVSLVQIDKRDLPAELARRLGDKPFQMAAAIVSTAERK